MGHSMRTCTEDVRILTLPPLASDELSCPSSGSWLWCVFFFSSRRRHTRWPRDWSSDVCSSDLLGSDRHQADIAGARDMRAAAKLERIDPSRRPRAVQALAHRDDADLLAIFLAEKGPRAHGFGLVRCHQPCLDGGVLADIGVHLALDRVQFGAIHRLLMGEIEAQPIRCHQRAPLRDMLAKLLAERLMQQMGGRVVCPDRAAAVMIDDKMRGLVGRDLALLDAGSVDVDAAGLALGPDDAGAPGGGADHACVADLTAGLGIEGRLVEDDRNLAILLSDGTVTFGAFRDQRHDLPLGFLGVIAKEIGRADTVRDLEPDGLVRRLAAAFPGSAGALLLLLHGGLEAGHVDIATDLAESIAGEIHGEAIGVIKPEGDLARQRRIRGQR